MWLQWLFLQQPFTLWLKIVQNGWFRAIQKPIFRDFREIHVRRLWLKPWVPEEPPDDDIQYDYPKWSHQMSRINTA